MALLWVDSGSYHQSKTKPRRPSIDEYASTYSNNSLNIWPHCDLNLDHSTFRIYSAHKYPNNIINQFDETQSTVRYRRTGCTPGRMEACTHVRTAWKHNASDTPIGGQKHKKRWQMIQTLQDKFTTVSGCTPRCMEACTHGRTAWKHNVSNTLSDKFRTVSDIYSSGNISSIDHAQNFS